MGIKRLRQQRGEDMKKKRRCRSCVGVVAVALALFGSWMLFESDNGATIEGSLLATTIEATSLLFDSNNNNSTTAAGAAVATNVTFEGEGEYPPTPDSSSSSRIPRKSSLGPGSKYAYVWLLGGCDADSPGYEGFFYTILISVRLLRRHNTTADFYVYLQMSPHAKDDRLSLKEHDILATLGVRYEYLPPPAANNFYEVAFNKLRCLELTEYKRVAFVDADNMPAKSLDYVFELSDKEEEPLLKPNLIVSGLASPVNAGFFMLEPEVGGWDRVREIIRLREEANGTSFDIVWGWGHVIQPGEGWQVPHSLPRNDEQRIWRYRGTHNDQGLLYHWVKYVKKSVSIFVYPQMQNWGTNNTLDGALVKESVHYKPLDKYSSPSTEIVNMDHLVASRGSRLGGMDYAPRRDYFHFTGPRKPWQTMHIPDFDLAFAYRDKATADNNTLQRPPLSPWAYWIGALQRLNDEFDLGLGDLKTTWTTFKRSIGSSPLGRKPELKDLEKSVLERRKKKNQDQTAATRA